MSYANDSFDVVICNAVLHFAESDDHFQLMVSELWRVLKPGGLLFVRLASGIGIESRLVQLEGQRYRLPDGTDRYLVTEEQLLKLTEKLYGTLLEPIKTVNVQGKRCMTTWVVKKPHIVFFDS
jgi:tellurite methyltransferase